MAERSHLIFISYRGSDQNWAAELVYARMTEAFGADAVFKAGTTLRAGDDFPPILRRAAASCPVMLACIGPGWLTATAADGSHRLDSPDDWVREEITISLRADNYLVPLLIGNHNEVSLPKPDQVPEPIRALVYRQAWRLAPGGGLDATIPMLVGRLAELVPELAERLRARSTTRLTPPAQAERSEARAFAAAMGTCEQGSTGRGERMPIEGELATLAEAAAVALVTAMGTNAWASVRDTVTGAFRRAGARRHDEIGDQLDADASLVASADDQRAKRAALQPFWLLRLTELVSAAPECVPDLQRRVQRLRDEAARPVSSAAPANSSRDRSAMSEPTINFNNSGAVIHGQVGILHGSINYGTSATGSPSADNEKEDDI